MAKYMGHKPKWSGGTKHQGGSAPPSPLKSWQYSPPARAEYPATPKTPPPSPLGLPGPDNSPYSGKWSRDLGALGRTPKGRAMLARLIGRGLRNVMPWINFLTMLDELNNTGDWAFQKAGEDIPPHVGFDMVSGPCVSGTTTPINYAYKNALTACATQAWTNANSASNMLSDPNASVYSIGNEHPHPLAPLTTKRFGSHSAYQRQMDYTGPALPFGAPAPEVALPLPWEAPNPFRRGFQYPRPTRRNVPKFWPGWSLGGRPGGSTGGGGSTGDWGSPNPAPPITKPDLDDDTDWELPTVHRPKPYERPAVQIPMGPRGPGKPVVVIHKDLPAQYPVKEVKWKLPRSKLGDFYGALTEIKDFLEAANAAIPDSPCGSGGLHTRFACVVKNAGRIDPRIFMREAARMQLEDYSIGKANQLANQITRSPYWRSPKGIGFGSFSQRMR